jgi:predicted nuclease of predicted toxin-antitoxin system
LKIAAALRQAGVTVEVHDDLFYQGAADEVWLQAAGEKNWVVLTKDKNIRFHAREKATLLAYGVRAFVLTAKALNAEEMADAFIKALPEIAKVLETRDGPFVATVTRTGSVRVVMTAPRL